MSLRRFVKALQDNKTPAIGYRPHNKVSHKLQPLDRGVFGPFKRYFNSECDRWIKNNPGKRMTIYNIPSLARGALPMAITPKNITAGFACSGIWPFNRDIFTEDDYAPSSVTDRPLEVVDVLETPETMKAPSTSGGVLSRSEGNSSSVIRDRIPASEEQRFSN